MDDDFVLNMKAQLVAHEAILRGLFLALQAVPDGASITNNAMPIRSASR